MAGFWFFVLIGLIAQFINSGLGMGFGVISNVVLLSLGLPPHISSAAIRLPKAISGSASAISHKLKGNFDKPIFLRILFTGIAGGVIGVFVLTLLPREYLRPIIAGYLMLMGVLILLKARDKSKRSGDEEAPRKRRSLPALAALAGFLDSVAGGSWGPILTSNLMADGNEPRKVIGSVNAAESFVSIIQAAAFLFFITIDFWEIILGLTLGGLVGAPLGAWLTTKLPKKMMLYNVGIAVILLSVYTISESLVRIFGQ